MALGFDKWLLLKVIEFLFVVGCLVCKRVTDDEESRLFLYLQKLSREWPFLNSVTWDRIGSAVADAVYGGYLIITLGMIIGRALKELPSKKRAMERFFLGIGAILFIVLGGLEFAALDSIPPDLVDNAAVLGTLSIITGLLFTIDLAAPRLKESTKQSQTSSHLQLKPLELATIYEIENGKKNGNGPKKEPAVNGTDKNGSVRQTSVREVQNSGRGTQRNGSSNNNNHRQKQKKFDIFGSDKDKEEIAELPAQMEKHSPVFSKVHKTPYYGHYDNVSPTYLRFQSELEEPPSTPGDPGYVQYTAKRWGQPSQKTPRNSPTEV